MSKHIVLLGDSIFDNKAYVGREPDVVEHLRGMLPSTWRASLLAVDGDTTAGLDRQLARVPTDASHLIISIGGNDALMNRDLLSTPVKSTTQALALIADRLGTFQHAYATAIDRALQLRKPTTVCTIYEGDLDPAEARVARVALMTFNDVILRAAFARNVPVIDLRFICNQPADYANPIEPSGSGGRKIACAVALACGAIDGAEPTLVHTRTCVASGAERRIRATP